MSNLRVLDLVIIALYLVGMVAVGVYFSRRNVNPEQYSSASGQIPGWAIGLSIYATFLSSNTFLGVPGKAFGTNWNAFVFSLSMPLAAWVGARYFVPFYRSTGEISAYTHLEHRFGSWARTYAVVCFLLTQLARIGSIFFGIALTLQALTGLSMEMIMLVTGVCIIVYTVLGGIEAVIWTEVVQGVIKTFGALLILYLIVDNMPGGLAKVMEVGQQHDKFSLGGFAPDFTQSTFWVVLLYGFFINLNNFGVDQNYVQRYHTAASAKQAAKSIWLCVWLYVPASLLFFVIGSALFAYYQVHPELIEAVKLKVAAEKLPLTATAAQISQTAAQLVPADYGDKVMPHFMVTKIPSGFVGLIVSAILSAAMSTISSGMNASATVFTADIYERYFHKAKLSGRQMLRALHLGTVVVGLLGMGTGIAMIGVKSVLDVWWELSGIFAAGMLGLFLLGVISRQTGNAEALTATAIGVLVILWMTFSSKLPEGLAAFRNPLHKSMIIVVGTLTIFLVGLLLARLRRNGALQEALEPAKHSVY
ncbi:sodium/solute symporter [Hymenobacter busanensis]|uniref:Sodium/solute symporter n=1 Tax=Hymenobacter busanensis TaxID=2607656 RepID=A0A7L4ZX13_9BACT|nr:sodium:solute symporter [Hymenobacter busanensis]KAA9339481.1 sodium/solute symporter [Hymenobacter busanensis]QHJ06762.1 sodium/solute symporter [Hymenobacter busanensis]